MPLFMSLRAVNKDFEGIIINFRAAGAEGREKVMEISTRGGSME